MASQGKQQQAEIAGAASQTEAMMASSGQADTASAQALGERIALDSENAFQQANQLFGMLQAQSEQNLATTEAMAQLQEQLGMSDINIARTMGEFNRSAGLMQLDATRQATLLEQQMNNAAIDEELAAKRYAIETAQSADQMNLIGAQKLNNIQSQGASGPGLFEMLPGLTQAGLGVYSAFRPPAALPARNLNPLYSAPGGATTGQNFSFGGGPNLGALPRFGSQSTGTAMSGNVPSLFNIG
jgi:hypothetical protein